MISVVVPVYNVEKYLERCVQSITSQTFEDIEIILVDDGSPDSSGRLCDDLKSLDSRIRVIHKTNGGLSSARNAGIDVARGEYIAFVDSDDYINHQMYEILYKNIIETDADISVCDFWWCDEGQVNDASVNANKIKVYEGTDILEMLRKDITTVIACNKLYKTTLFDGLRYPFGMLHEDEFLIHRILCRCSRTVYTESKLYYYMRHDDSITSRLSIKGIADYFVGLDDRISCLRENGAHAEAACWDKMWFDIILYEYRQCETGELSDNENDIKKYLKTRMRDRVNMSYAKGTITLWENMEFKLWLFSPRIYERYVAVRNYIMSIVYTLIDKFANLLPK